MQPTTDPRALKEDGMLLGLEELLGRIDGDCMSTSTVRKRLARFRQAHNRLPTFDEVIGMATEDLSKRRPHPPSGHYMQPTTDPRFRREDGKKLSLREILERIDGPCVSVRILRGRLWRFRQAHNRLPTLEELIDMAREPVRTPGLPVEIDGKIYPSLAAVAHTFGLSQTVLWRRVRLEGMDPAEAVKQVLSGHAGERTTIGGRTYPSLTAAARAHGVNPKTLHHRIKVRGMSPEEAVRQRTRYSTSDMSAPDSSCFLAAPLKTRFSL
jgi:hypothetical protein